MKRRMFIVALLFAAVAVGGVQAQGVYFDIGFGAGWAWTKLDGKDVAKLFNDAGARLEEIGVEVGMKAGYGPLGNTPLYIVGEIAGIGHRFSDSSGYIQFNSYLIGGGIIFYPVTPFQLALDLGYSRTANKTDIPNSYMLDSKGGCAFNISAAYDLGSKNHGCLLGLRYFITVNEIETTNVEQIQSGLNFFIKYAFRHKVKRQPQNK